MAKRASISTIGTVRVTALGGLRLETASGALTDEINRSQKLWSVLCYLLVHRHRSVPQTELLEVFWEEDRSSNPANALKTLLYRVRALLEPLFPDGPDPILSQRGAYLWNPAISCQVDAEQFEELCRKAADPARDPEERRAFYRQAAELYQGDLLPKQATQTWAIPLITHFHGLFLDAVKDFAGLLEQIQDYEEMERLCTRASQLDPLDESLHILIVRAMLRQGKDTAALKQYEYATDLLYRSLGVRPSEELRELYRAIMDVEKGMETDLEVIQAHLKETAHRPGAFVCEYGFFREIYRLEARRAVRSGACVHLALVTVSQADGGDPPLNVITATKDQLLECLVGNLRRGDVVSRYSSSQYVVLLPAANFEDSTMVMDRIVTAFCRQHRRNFLKLSYKIRELELN